MLVVVRVGFEEAFEDRFEFCPRLRVGGERSVGQAGFLGGGEEGGAAGDDQGGSFAVGGVDGHVERHGFAVDVDGEPHERVVLVFHLDGDDFNAGSGQLDPGQVESGDTAFRDELGEGFSAFARFFRIGVEIGVGEPHGERARRFPEFHGAPPTGCCVDWESSSRVSQPHAVDDHHDDECLQHGGRPRATNGPRPAWDAVPTGLRGGVEGLVRFGGASRQ